MIPVTGRYKLESVAKKQVHVFGFIFYISFNVPIYGKWIPRTI